MSQVADRLTSADGTESRASGLSSLNDRLSRRWIFRTSVLLIFVAATASYLLPMVLDGSLGDPPQRDDGPEYEAVAFHLWRGEGFAVDWDNPEYLAPYRQLAATGAYVDLEAKSGKGLTAYRPPLMPVLMAGSYRAFGRRFEPIRIVNALAMAGALALGFALIFHRFGFFPAWLAGLALLAWDPRPAVYARLVLTESLACLLMMVMAWLCLRLARTGSRKTAALAGLCFGLLVLTRSIYILFVPVLAGMVWLGFRARSRAQASPLADERESWPVLRRGERARLLALFLAGSLLVTGPWMIRNCLVLEGVQPLGTMGGAYLPLGYSDACVYSGGAWYDIDKTDFFAPVALTGSNLENEKARARYGQAEALTWIRQNPHLLPTLVVYKVWHLWRPYTMREGFLLVCALFGALLLRDTRYAAVCLAILAANSLAVALTWSVGIRFLVPLLPIQLMLAAPFAWAAILAVSDLRNVVSRQLRRE